MSLLRTRETFEAEESERLAPFAVRSAESRGRVHAESPHPYRTAFQRDRDRIVHSRAFRRLEYKTQVFVHHEGDHFRNRLTHTLEAGQIARTIARILRLNEELAEAIVLAHDLGHTPFGHAGERVLADLLADDGGFDHNRQSLRVVDWLEDRYPEHRGLNLTHETREGICKHGVDWEHPVAVPALAAQPTLEAQVADAADEIAYVNHDLDDGLRSGLLTLESLEGVVLWNDTRGDVASRMPGAREAVWRAQTIVSLINLLVTDLVECTSARVGAAGAASPDDVRAGPERLVAYSPEIAKRKAELKEFLYERLYHHPNVLAASGAGGQVLGDLFTAFRRGPARLPGHVRARFAEDGEARAIADYVAGMTDRFALAEHQRLVEPRAGA